MGSESNRQRRCPRHAASAPGLCQECDDTVCDDASCNRNCANEFCKVGGRCDDNRCDDSVFHKQGSRRRIRLLPHAGPNGVTISFTLHYNSINRPQQEHQRAAPLSLQLRSRQYFQLRSRQYLLPRNRRHLQRPPVQQSALHMQLVDRQRLCAKIREALFILREDPLKSAKMDPAKAKIASSTKNLMDL